MTQQRTLKERILTDEPIKVVRVAMSSSTEEIQETLRRDPCDLLYIDSQHGPHTEWDIARIDSPSFPNSCTLLVPDLPCVWE